MFNIRNIIFVALLFILFVFCAKQVFKKIDESDSGWRKVLFKLNWWKLFLEFYLISFVFYISIRIFGLFGIDLTEIIKLEENFWLLEISFFLIAPVSMVIFAVLIPFILMKALHYSREERRCLQLVYCFLANKFYALMALANILHWLKSKIF